MSYDIKEFLKKFFSSRLFVLSAVFIAFFAVIILRVFVLQIVNGKSYQENFSLKIQQTLAISMIKTANCLPTMSLRIPFPSLIIPNTRQMRKKTRH